MTGQWQDSRDVLGPFGEYQRATPPAIDRSAVVGTATLAVAEALARLGRKLAIRIVADDRSADLAGVPPEVLMLPAATAARRLPGLATPAIGPPPAGGLTLTVGPGRPRSGTAAVSVACVVGDEVRVRVECAPDDPWGRSATAAAEIVAEVLSELLADPTRSPADAAGLGAASRRRVLTDLAGPVAPPGRFRPLASLVEAQVDRDPERPAVVHAGATLTYGRLDRLANGLARELGELGVTRGDLVPLLLGNSLELPVSMLALLKLGAAFVPLDGQWPDRRLATALDVLDRPLTITAPGAPVPQGKELPVRIASLVETGERPGVAVGPDDLAYGVFTSGTTGNPRCALNRHGGLVNRLRFMTRWFGPAPDGVEVVLQNSKHTFDSAVWQLFWPLTTGGRTVVPAPGDFLDLRHTVETIATHGVTVTDFVPTTFNLLVARLAADPDALRRLGALRHLVVGGEEISPLQVHRLRRLLPGLRVSNAYGPSETAIGMVFHDVLAADGDDVPLGRPIDNCAAVVVDERLRPLPAGAVGEILIGGACVGAGYLGAPEPTTAKFVPNPFPQVPGQLLYRSGDLGWYDPRGRLHFGGRRDFQAKVNGVRIELGEVELAAEGCPGVRQATVLVAGTDAGRGLAVFAATDGTVTEPDAARPPAPAAAAHLAAPARGRAAGAAAGRLGQGGPLGAGRPARTAAGPGGDVGGGRGRADDRPSGCSARSGWRWPSRGCRPTPTSSARAATRCGRCRWSPRCVPASASTSACRTCSSTRPRRRWPVSSPVSGPCRACRRTSGRRWTPTRWPRCPGRWPRPHRARYGPCCSPARPGSSGRSWRTSCWPAPTRGWSA